MSPNESWNHDEGWTGWKKGILSLWSSPFVCKRTSRSNSPKVKRAVNEGKKAPCPNSLGKRAKNGGGQIQQGKANRGHQDKFDNSRADLDLKNEMNEVKYKPISVACMCATDKKNESCCNAMVFEINRLESKQRWKKIISMTSIPVIVREIFWRWSIDLLRENRKKHQSQNTWKLWSKWTTTSLLWWWHTAGIWSMFLPKYCKCQFLFLLEYCKGLEIGFHWTLMLIVLDGSDYIDW